jgi:sugar phosphate isomerase/epimerase
MELGLKLYPHNLELAESFNDLFDFFELYIHPDHIDFDILRHCKKITIHCAHYAQGFDPCDPTKEDLNTHLLNLSKKAADITGSEWIIVHPGIRNNKDSLRYMIHFLKKNWDKRIIIENLVPLDLMGGEESYLCSTPEEMNQVISELNTQMILDFGHAICTANLMKQNPIIFSEVLALLLDQEFLMLNN